MMMTRALATVDGLATRLGVTLDQNENDYARAEAAIWDASVRAVEITERDWSGDDETVPYGVVRIVLACAQRLFRNPDRFLVNQAGSFQAQLATSDFSTGDIFLSAEIAALGKYKPSPGRMWVIESTREDGTRISEPENPKSYITDGLNEGRGDPFYVGTAW